MFAHYRKNAVSGVAQSLWVTILSGSIASQVLGQGPVIHYTFDEASGPALDSGSGVASDGALGSTVVRATNTPGMASPFAIDLRAPGTESVVNGGDSAEVDALTTFTLTTWLLLEGLNADQGGIANVRLVAKQAPVPFDGISWNLNNPLDGARSIDNFKLGMFVGGRDAFGFAQSTESLGASAWTFLAATYDGNEEFDNLRFYIGDELSETALLGLPLSIFAGPVLSSSGEADFGIGFTDATPDGDVSAIGFQDDVRVYNRVLSLSELEEVRLANLESSPGLACDFDGNNSCGLDDINALTVVGNLVDGVSVPPADAQFDLDGNNVVDSKDLDLFLLYQPEPILRGDTDFDGVVAFADFLRLSDAFGLAGAVWGQGDFDGNGTVEFSDFLQLSGNFGSGSDAVAAVPEPLGCSAAVIGLICLVAFRSRERTR